MLVYVPGGEVQLVGGALHETPPLPPAVHLVSMYIHVKVILPVSRTDCKIL